MISHFEGGFLFEIHGHLVLFVCVFSSSSQACVFNDLGQGSVGNFLSGCSCVSDFCMPMGNRTCMTGFKCPQSVTLNCPSYVSIFCGLLCASRRDGFGRHFEIGDLGRARKLNCNAEGARLCSDVKRRRFTTTRPTGLHLSAFTHLTWNCFRMLAGPWPEN